MAEVRLILETSLYGRGTPDFRDLTVWQRYA